MWWDKKPNCLFVLSFIIVTSVRYNINNNTKIMYFKIKYCSYFKTLLALIVCILISGKKANILNLYEGEFKILISY